MEREHYGQHRIRQTETVANVAWTKMLPARYLSELADRDPWFGNHTFDPAQGGSYLANITGVNSAYCGISVLLFALLALTSFWSQRSTAPMAYSTVITTIVMLYLIFWEGLRHHLFYSMGHQLSLPTRWLGPFLFPCLRFGMLWRLEFRNSHIQVNSTAIFSDADCY